MNTREHHNCPACNSSRTGKGITYRDLPIFLFPVSHEVAARVPKRDLVLKRCLDCEHLFQERVDFGVLREIYEDLYRFYPLGETETFKGPYREPFERMFEAALHLLPKDTSLRLLDIGCASAEQLVPFRSRGLDCTGIDPNPNLATNQEQPGLRLVRGYYEDVKFEQSFDLIVSRFNLEHVVDPQVYVSKLKADLSANGIALVQVPNCAYYLKHRAPMFGAHEHIHYFNLVSMTRLFAAHGLHLVGMLEKDQPSLIAAFSRRSDFSTEVKVASPDGWQHFTSVQEGMESSFASLIAKHKRVVPYGAGVALYWLLPALERQSKYVECVLDDNKMYAGLNIPAFNLQVRAPTKELLKDADAVVLSLNPMYHAKVVARLRELNDRAEILLLDETGLKRGA